MRSIVHAIFCYVSCLRTASSFWDNFLKSLFDRYDNNHNNNGSLGSRWPPPLLKIAQLKISQDLFLNRPKFVWKIQAISKSLVNLKKNSKRIALLPRAPRNPRYASAWKLPKIYYDFLIRTISTSNFPKGPAGYGFCIARDSHILW